MDLFERDLDHQMKKTGFTGLLEIEPLAKVLRDRASGLITVAQTV